MAKLNNKKNMIQRRGIALTELAIVLPLLLWLTFGIMEYGWLFYKSHQIANAARQGARVGARPDADATTVDAAVFAVMDAAGISPYELNMNPEGGPSGLLAGEAFTVEVRVTYADIDLGLPLIPKPTELASEVTMAREGP